MYIKILEQQELLDAMSLVWNVFIDHTAPLYSEEGVEEFRSFINIANITEKFNRKEAFLWGAYEGTELLGVSMVTKTGHVCLLDVRTAYQGYGVGKALMDAMKQFCVHSLYLNSMDVHAAPNAVAVYQNLGFLVSAHEQIVNGIRFVPMNCVILGTHSPKEKKAQTGLIIGILTAILLVCGLTVALIVIAIGRGGNEDIPQDQRNDRQESKRFDDEDYEDDDEDYEDEDNNDFDSLTEYMAEDLSFEVQIKNYDLDESVDERVLAFLIEYPEIVGLEGDKASEINKLFEEFAMQTPNKFYINPSQETKEQLLESEQFSVFEEVTCQVLYVSEDVISVLFKKIAYTGGFMSDDASDMSMAFMMRGMTVNLKDGAVYETKDLFNYDDAFMEEWEEIMIEEAGGSLDMFENLTTEERKEILTGMDEGAGYYSVFFLSEEGIQIGISYPSGCVTAPYSWDKLKEDNITTDSPLWSILDQLK